MRITLCGILFGLFLSPISLGEAAEEPAVTSVPEIVVAEMVDRQTIEIKRFSERMITRTTTTKLPPGLKLELNGVPVTEQTTTEIVPILETQTTRHDTRSLLFHRVNGRAVSTEEIGKELAQPTSVLWLKPSQRLDPIMAKLFKPESLVLQSSAAVPRTISPIPVSPAPSTP